MSSPARAPALAVDTGLLRWHAERLVADVQKSNPARRAALRHGVGHPPEHVSVRAAHATVARHIPAGADVSTEWALYAVAALIAAQPRSARDMEAAANGDAEPDTADEQRTASDEAPVTAESLSSEDTAIAADRPSGERAVAKQASLNLGATLAGAVLAQRLNADTTEARLHLLCRQDLAGLHRQLPRLSAHLRSSQTPVPIDWVTLIGDLAQWGTNRDRVAKQWLQSYYRTLAANRGRTAASGTSGTAETPESETS